MSFIETKAQRALQDAARAAVADVITPIAASVPDGEKLGPERLSRLVLERAVSPWESRDIDTVGIKNLSLAELTFTDVRVPKENILGAAGAGAEQFHRGIESSRVFVGIQAAGIAQRALDIAMAYAKERTAFGRPIGKFQGIQMALADAATRLQAARLLCLNALAILDSGRRAPRDVSMAKLFAVETAITTCQVAMESMGERLIIGRELLGMAAFT